MGRECRKTRKFKGRGWSGYNQYLPAISTVWTPPRLISHLRWRPGLTEIQDMTRDQKTLAWLAPLATSLSAWWVLRSTPCLEFHWQNQWSRWFPPTPRPIGPAARADTVVVENPYGIVTCDHWPETSDDVRLTAKRYAHG